MKEYNHRRRCTVVKYRNIPPFNVKCHYCNRLMDEETADKVCVLWRGPERDTSQSLLEKPVKDSCTISTEAALTQRDCFENRNKISRISRPRTTDCVVQQNHKPMRKSQRSGDNLTKKEAIPLSNKKHASSTVRELFSKINSNVDVSENIFGKNLGKNVPNHDLMVRLLGNINTTAKILYKSEAKICGDKDVRKMKISYCNGIGQKNNGKNGRHCTQTIIIPEKLEGTSNTNRYQHDSSNESNSKLKKSWSQNSYRESQHSCLIPEKLEKTAAGCKNKKQNNATPAEKSSKKVSFNVINKFKRIYHTSRDTSETNVSFKRLIEKYDCPRVHGQQSNILVRPEVKRCNLSVSPKSQSAQVLKAFPKKSVSFKEELKWYVENRNQRCSEQQLRLSQGTVDLVEKRSKEKVLIRQQNLNNFEGNDTYFGGRHNRSKRQKSEAPPRHRLLSKRREGYCELNSQNFDSMPNYDIRKSKFSDKPIHRSRYKTPKMEVNLPTKQDDVRSSDNVEAPKLKPSIINAFREKSAKDYDIVRHTLKNFSFDKHFPQFKHEFVKRQVEDLMKEDSCISLYRTSKSKDSLFNDDVDEQERIGAEEAKYVNPSSELIAECCSEDILDRSVSKCSELVQKTSSFVREQVKKYNELVDKRPQDSNICEDQNVKTAKRNFVIKPASKFQLKENDLNNRNNILDSIKQKISEFQTGQQCSSGDDDNWTEEEGEYLTRVSFPKETRMAMTKLLVKKRKQQLQKFVNRQSKSLSSSSCESKDSSVKLEVDGLPCPKNLLCDKGIHDGDCNVNRKKSWPGVAARIGKISQHV